MGLTFSCLILDHDDTAVSSAAEIHHRSHVETMSLLRPGAPVVSVEQWMLKNFHPGIMDFLTIELGFDEREIEEEYRIWRSFSTKIIPHFYPGFLEALSRYRRLGGLIAVVSHSEKDIIEAHYRAEFDRTGVFPDLVLGWEQGEGKRKPDPWPVLETLRVLGVERDRALVVDDLKPGVLMAHAAQVPVAAAGWGHQIQDIRSYMEAVCDYYLPTIADFERLILSETPRPQ